MIEIIKQRLQSYKAKNSLEEEQATKEILQEITLYALWRAKFFDVAAFQGGTSLRILHGLPRFSEDLDFILKTHQSDFNWGLYLEPVLNTLAEFGLNSEALNKGRMEQRIKKAVLKDNSITNQLNLSYYNGHADQKIKIKLEIDTHPPDHSDYGHTYIDFPLDFEICHQDLSSNFSLKIHSLLCRPFLKGRDWYDFNWYLKQQVTPNLPHLQAALEQFGPWKNQNLTIDLQWLKETLKQKIETINWHDAASDVERFLNAEDQQSLKLWSREFFTTKLDAM